MLHNMDKCNSSYAFQAGSRLLQAFQQMRLEEEGTDVVLVCEEKLFPAHKVVLMASSAYFRTLFKSSFPEAKLAQLKLNIANTIMEKVLNFIYNPDDDNLTLSSLTDTVDLLEAANFLQMDQLFEWCCGRIQQLEPRAENFQLIVRLNKYEYSARNILQEFISTHHLTLLEELYLDYAFDEFKILISVICSKRLLTNECLVGKIIAWLETNEAAVHDCIIGLISLACKHEFYDQLVTSLMSNAAWDIPNPLSRPKILAAIFPKLPSTLASMQQESCTPTCSSNDENTLLHSLNILQFKMQGTDPVCIQGSFHKQIKAYQVALPFELLPDMKCIRHADNVYMVGTDGARRKNITDPWRYWVFSYCIKTNSVEFVTGICAKSEVEQIAVTNDTLIVIEETREATDSCLKRVHYSELCNLHTWKFRDVKKSFKVTSCFFVFSDQLRSVELCSMWSGVDTKIETIIKCEFVVQHGNELGVEPDESVIEPAYKYCRSRLSMTSSNTVVYKNKMFTFHESNVYVYDPERNSTECRPSGIEVQKNDVIYPIAGYDKAFCVIIRGDHSDKEYSYKLFDVEQKRVVAQMKMEKGPTVFETAVLG